MRARIGISGSSISANSRSTPSSRSACSSDGRTASDDERLEPGRRDRRQPGRRGREHEVQPLPDDVGDLLGPQRGVDEVGGDLGVELDGRRRGVRVLGEPGRQQRLDVVARRAGRRSPPAGGAGRSRRRRRPRPPRARRRRRRRATAARPASGRGSSTTSPVPTAGWARSHVSRPATPPSSTTSIRPGSTIAAASAPGRSPDGGGDRLGARLDRGRRRGDGRRVAADRAAPRPRRSPSTAGATPGSTGGAAARRRRATHALGRREPGLAQLAHRGDRVLGPLPDERRQPVDQGPELVLAEQPDDRPRGRTPPPARGSGPGSRRRRARAASAPGSRAPTRGAPRAGRAASRA